MEMTNRPQAHPHPVLLTRHLNSTTLGKCTSSYSASFKSSMTFLLRCFCLVTLLVYTHKHIPDLEQRQGTLQPWRLILMVLSGGFRGRPTRDSMSHLRFAPHEHMLHTCLTPAYEEQAQMVAPQGPVRYCKVSIAELTLACITRTPMK